MGKLSPLKLPLFHLKLKTIDSKLAWFDTQLSIRGSVALEYQKTKIKLGNTNLKYSVFWTPFSL